MTFGLGPDLFSLIGSPAMVLFPNDQAAPFLGESLASELENVNLLVVSAAVGSWKSLSAWSPYTLR